MSKRIAHAQFRNGSSQLLRDIGLDREPRIVTNHGEPVEVLHPATDEEMIRADSGLDIAVAAAKGSEEAESESVRAFIASGADGNIRLGSSEWITVELLCVVNARAQLDASLRRDARAALWTHRSARRHRELTPTI